MLGVLLALVAFAALFVLLNTKVHVRGGERLFAMAMCTLVPLYVWFCVAAKRLHDRDQTAFYAPGVFLLIALRIALDVSGITRHSPAANVVTAIAALAIALWFIIALGTLRGTVGDNRYGPDPLPPPPAPVAAA
jgi:uncharacterized membrane protein YhaH (DUF805 family)